MKKNYANRLIKYCLFCLLVTIIQKLDAQAPVITYSGPQTYYVGLSITPLTPSYSGSAFTAPNGQTVTFAGSGAAGSVNGTGTSASFHVPAGTVVDASGNVYVADASNNLIRKITPAGVVTTFAGSGVGGSANGTGTAASFFYPVGICVDVSGNLYVGDENNNLIRKITSAGVVTTLAGSGAQGSLDGTGTLASFYKPMGVAVDASGNVYVGDNSNNKIRMITPSGVVTTLAGSGALGSADGVGIAATFNQPSNVALDTYGNLYIADCYNHKIRKLVLSTGVVTTIAGSGNAAFADGTGTAASFYYPAGITFDKTGNLYVVDYQNNRIRCMSPTGVVTTLAGTGIAGSANGVGASSTFNHPWAIAIDASGYLYVGDLNTDLVRKVASTAFGIAPYLPAGLNFNTANGFITGTPTATASATNYTITAYNSAGSGANTLNITVQPANNTPSLTSGNAVRTDIVKVSGITSQGQILTGVNAETEVSYMDGLGRPVQRIEQQASPLGHDIVQILAYDQYGRQPTQYLPYTATTNNGQLQTNAVTAQNVFYQVTGQQIAVDNAPFAGTVYDNTPLQRVQEQAAPGTAWQTAGSQTSGWQTGGVHDLKGQFRLNTAADQIMIWTSGGPTSTYYGASRLSVNSMTDENGNQVLSFTNQLGQVVDKKVQASATEWLETVYIYDDTGNVLFQVSPEGVRRIYASLATWGTAFITTWATSYIYDAKGRMVTKQAPGAQPVYMVYDGYNRLVLIQDGRLRGQHSTDTWYATKYDITNRVVVSGLYTYATPPNPVGPTDQQILQNYLDGLTYNSTTVFSYETRASGTTYGYTDQSFPLITDANVLSVNYYDDYNYYNTTATTKYFFNGTTAIQYQNPNQTGFASVTTTDTHGFLTGTMARVITPAGNNGGWITQAVFYDQYGNPI